MVDAIFRWGSTAAPGSSSPGAIRRCTSRCGHDARTSRWQTRSDPPVRGWEEVSARLDLAASKYRDGRDYEYENVSTVVTGDLAYTVEVERVRTRVGGSDELAPVAIRATTVFRREDGRWRVTHRHGDPITTMQSPFS